MKVLLVFLAVAFYLGWRRRGDSGRIWLLALCLVVCFALFSNRLS